MKSFGKVFAVCFIGSVRATAVCQPDVYCQQQVDPGSWCKTYQTTPTCALTTKTVLCKTCGVTSTTSSTTKPASSTLSTKASTTMTTKASTTTTTTKPPTVVSTTISTLSTTTTKPSATTATATTTKATTTTSTTKPTTVVSTTSSTLSTTTTTPATTTTITATTTTVTTTKASTTTSTASVSQATMSCDQYCISLNGGLSYCKTWLTPRTCSLGNQPCDICGGTASTTTATTVSLTTMASTTAANPASSSTLSTTTTKASSIVSATTTTPTTTTSTQAASSSIYAMSCNDLCASLNGSGSYCKDWLAHPTCSGGDQSCELCGGVASATTTGSASSVATTLAPTSTLSSPAGYMACDDLCTTLNGPDSYCRTYQTTPTCYGGGQKCTSDICGGPKSTTTVPPPRVAPTDLGVPLLPSTECEKFVATPVPLFVWIEGPSMYGRSEFVAFYQKLKIFLESNCANIRPTTLVIRTAHPYYVPKADIVYWPPESSPLFTELLSKLNIGTKIRVLLYPYIFDSFARSQWIRFATSGSVDAVLPRPSYDATTSTAANVLKDVNIYDGIFQYVKGWQKAVAKVTSAVSVDGFVIDYEEVWRYPDPAYLVKLSADEVLPYKALYPTVSVGTTFGYDDVNKINLFDPFMDQLFLQAYDLYWPYVGADATDNSPFFAYQNDPDLLSSVLLQKVFTSKILTPYQGRLNKIYIMWSTQSLKVTNCLYKINDGSCGINNEFGSWRPDAFNVFIQKIMQKSDILALVQHGMYTYNFVTPTWLPQSARALP